MRTPLDMTGSHKDNLNDGLSGALFQVRLQFRPGTGNYPGTSITEEKVISTSKPKFITLTLGSLSRSAGGLG